MTNLREHNCIMYYSLDREVNIQVLTDVQNETIWLNQKQIVEVFGVNVPAMNKHVKNILEDNEVDKSTISKMEIVRYEAGRQVKREIEHYNLDMIIVVGYRVNSKKATQFRVWATKVLREYLIKGFALDDDRLKQGNTIFNRNYVDDLRERIRAIRASEKNFYAKIRDIFSLSYDSKSDTTRKFYAHIQNKLEYAIVGKTAGEIIKERANHKLQHMGRTDWEG